MKGILKKGLAILKRGVCLLPAFVFVGGLVTGIVGDQVGKKKTNEFYDDFSKTEAVVEMKEEDLSFYQAQAKEGEISNIELSEKQEYIQSKEYLEKIIELPEFAEQKEILKSTKETYQMTENIGFYTILGSLGFIGVTGGLWLTTHALDFMEDLWDSASDDWNWSYYNLKSKEEDNLEIDI